MPKVIPATQAVRDCCGKRNSSFGSGTPKRAHRQSDVAARKTAVHWLPNVNSPGTRRLRRISRAKRDEGVAAPARRTATQVPGKSPPTVGDAGERRNYQSKA